MKLETHNSDPPSANETVEDPLEKGNLDTASTESDEYPVEVKSSEEPSKESRKEYLLDTDSRNADSAPTGINDDGFWPVAEFGDPKSAEVKMVEEKTEYLQVPELVVCYKENPELNIKDICIDDNMSSCEKILFERDTDKEDLCSFLLPEKNSITEFKEEGDVSAQEVSTHDHDSKMKTNVVDDDKSVKTINMMQEAAIEVPEELSDDIREENIQETVEEPNEEPCPLPYSVDAGVENNSNRDYDNFQSKNISDLFREQHGLGESSFSMAGPMSNLITYSGPIVHSSRSDASSASTRSFAFPVLYPEWQSSPVRLPRADRGNLRKPKWWRHGLLCCRF